MESVFSAIKKKRWYRLNDTVSSLGTGSLMQLAQKLMGKTLLYERDHFGCASVVLIVSLGVLIEKVHSIRVHLPEFCSCSV